MSASVSRLHVHVQYHDRPLKTAKSGDAKERMVPVHSEVGAVALDDVDWTGWTHDVIEGHGAAWLDPERGNVTDSAVDRVLRRHRCRETTPGRPTMRRRCSSPRTCCAKPAEDAPNA